MTGIICINKEEGITSFGAVARVRGITKEKKVGHTGTLDPMATGVLPVMLGGATRFLNFLPNSDKGYRAELKLGITTDTLDITGNVTGKYEVNASVDDVKAVLADFTGVIQQVPPMYSAKSVDGVRLYDLAREGKIIEREPCTVEIKELSLACFDENEHTYTIDVLCSKGTYIRSLIDDIGARLGCGAVMTRLCRTQAMGFDLSRCVTLDELEQMKNDGTGFESALIGIEEIFSCYKSVCVSSAQSTRFFNGGALDIKRVKAEIGADEICTVYSDKKEFLGLGQRIGDELKPIRVLSVRE